MCLVGQELTNNFHMCSVLLVGTAGRLKRVWLALGWLTCRIDTRDVG